jgi:hypothetical protein
MTKDEIDRAVDWRDTYEARFECFVPAFDQTVKVSFFTHAAETISDRSVQIVNDFIALADQHISAVKGYLWQDCQSCCETLSWGVYVPDGKTEAEANHEDIEVFNAEDAYRKSTLSLGIYEDDQQAYASNYGHLSFDTPWNSHIVCVVMKNGDIVGYGDSGLWLGAFER